MLERNQYRKALRLFQQAMQAPDQKLSAHNGAAICYMGLGDEKQAMEEIEEAFRYGYLLHYFLQDKPLGPLRLEMDQRFKILRPQYLASLDTVLRKEIQTMVHQDQLIRHKVLQQTDLKQKESLREEMKKNDSLNIQHLKDIVKKYGWPGFRLIGNRQTYPSDLDADATLLVTHAGEADNQYFLEAALKKVKLGEASWWDAYGIMKNLVFRFAEDGHNKLRYIAIDGKGNLNREESFFQLKVLSDFLKDNPLQKITLFVVRYEDEKSDFMAYQNLLSQVRDFLIREGIPAKSVTTREKIKLVNDDGLGRYRIAYVRE